MTLIWNSVTRGSSKRAINFNKNSPEIQFVHLSPSKVALLLKLTELRPVLSVEIVVEVDPSICEFRVYFPCYSHPIKAVESLKID